MLLNYNIFLAATEFLLFNLFLFLPTLYNFLIIPKIEKRVERKLKIPKIYNYLYPSFTRWGLFYSMYPEIALGIVIRCLSLKIFKNPNKIKFLNSISLRSVNYKIHDASRLEILISFYAVFNSIFSIIYLLYIAVFIY